MNLFQRASLYSLLAVSLLFNSFCCSEAAASDQNTATRSRQTAITVNQNPVQEEVKFLTASQLAEEENLMAILWVQRSAEFRGLSYQAYNMAAMEIDRALAQRKRNKKKTSNNEAALRPLAVVLDIDDTIVSHAPLEAYYMEHPEAKANYAAWEKWIAQQQKFLPGAKDFLNYAAAHNIQVFYVTGRGPQDRDTTLAFLRKAGLPLPDATHLRMNDRSGSKMNHFNALAQKYDIVCYLGDNVADFPIGALRDENKTRNAKVDAVRNSFGAKFILLPNPMYGDWEYNLAKKYRSLPSDQRIALRKAAMKSFAQKK